MFNISYKYVIKHINMKKKLNGIIKRKHLKRILTLISMAMFHNSFIFENYWAAETKGVLLLGKLDALNQYCFNTGPALQTVVQQ